MNKKENGFAVTGTLRLLQRGDMTLEQTTEIVNMWIEITAKKFYSEGVLDGLRRNTKIGHQGAQGQPTRSLNDSGIDLYKRDGKRAEKWQGASTGQSRL